MLSNLRRTLAKNTRFSISSLIKPTPTYNLVRNFSQNNQKKFKDSAINFLKFSTAVIFVFGPTYMSFKREESGSYYSGKENDVAAAWWAQYLPGVKKVTLKEINKNILDDKHFMKIEDLMLHRALHDSSDYVTKEQYIKFTNELKNQIHKLPLITDYEGLSYRQIGNAMNYGPPQIVEHALKKAGMEGIGFGMFPYKTEMKVYTFGHVQIGDSDVICTNPEYTHYKSFDFSNSHLMKISGKKFKLFEVPLEGTFLFYRFWNSVHPLDPITLKEPKSKDIPKKAYVKLTIKDFKAGESKFMELSNTAILKVLQDRELIKQNFNSTAIDYYPTKEKALQDTSFGHIGEAKTEVIDGDNNIYQYTTGPVHVKSVPKKGTIGEYGLVPLKEKDFLVQRSNGLKYLRGEGFFAQQCDAKGKLLSEEIYKPGDDLPNPNNTI